MRWRRKRVDLAERLRPYVEQHHRLLAEPMVDADPIRMFLFRWMIETGDPIDVMAVGFDVDPQRLGGILHRTKLRLPSCVDVELRKRLGPDCALSYDTALYRVDKAES